MYESTNTSSKLGHGRASEDKKEKISKRARRCNAEKLTMVVVQSGAQRMADQENVERQKRGFQVEGAGRVLSFGKPRGRPTSCTTRMAWWS